MVFRNSCIAEISPGEITQIDIVETQTIFPAKVHLHFKLLGMFRSDNFRLVHVRTVKSRLLLDGYDDAVVLAWLSLVFPGSAFYDNPSHPVRVATCKHIVTDLSPPQIYSLR